MPPYDPNDEFDPQRDIAPYAAVSLFDDISNDRNLTSRSRSQLQGTLLGGIQDIELQRLKLQQEREEGNLRRQRMAQGSIALEVARMQLDRERQAAAAATNAESDMRSIVDSDADPVTKADALNRWAFDNPYALANPAVEGRFRAAQDIIGKAPKSPYTNEQLQEAGEYGVPREILADPYARGRFIGDAKERRRLQEVQRKNEEQAAEKGEARDYAAQHELARDRQQKKLGSIRFKNDPATGAAAGFRDEDAGSIQLLLEDEATKEEREKFSKAPLADQHKLLLDLQGRVIRGEKRKTPADKASRSGL